MKRVLCMLLSVLMILSLAGCTPEPTPSNNKETVKDDLFSGEQLEILEEVRKYLINTGNADKVMSKFENCPHHYYLSEKKDEASVGYSWLIQPSFDSPEDYDVVLSYLYGLGATNEWQATVSKGENGYFFKEELSTAVYEDDISDVIRAAAAYLADNKINEQFSFKDLPLDFHIYDTQPFELAHMGYTWDVKKVLDGLYDVSLVEIMGMGASEVWHSSATVSDAGVKFEEVHYK